MNWRVEYDNDTGTSDEGYSEWWTVTNEDIAYRAFTEESARKLCDILNKNIENK